MGVFINSGTDTLNQTSSVPALTSFTLMGDCNIALNSGTSNLQPLFGIFDATLGDGVLVMWNESASFQSMNLVCTDASSVTSRHTFVSRPEVCRPFNWFVKCSGSGAGKVVAGWRYPGQDWHLGYVTLTGTLAAPTQIIYGQIAGAYYSFLTHQNIKTWSRALTSDELMQESESWAPVVRNGLHSWCPLTSAANVTDLSGNARNMTASGTLDTRPVPFLRGPARRIPVPYEPPVGGGVFQILTGRRFSLAGAHGLAGD